MFDPSTRLPHDNWAQHYDSIYEREFGHFYHWLTEANLKLIRSVEPTANRIVDFGAGTGRLALPLLEEGWDVVAVEPSRPMADQLHSKAEATGLQAPQIIVETMENARIVPRADLAVCVFTVINYVVDPAALARSFLGMSEALRPEGSLLLDIAHRQLFGSRHTRLPGLDRLVEITPAGNVDCFDYRETTRLETDSGWVVVEDSFPLRYWPRPVLEEMWTAAGFTLVADQSSEMAGSGADYVVLRKAP